MNHRRRTGGLLPALTCLLALGACGESAEDKQRKADEQDVTAVIRKATTSTDPSVCTTVRTRAYVEQLEGERGRAAVRSCRRSLKADAARDVEVSSVHVRGDSASAHFEPRGGSYDGQALTVTLLRGKRSWRLDEATAAEIVSRERFDRALRTSLAAPPDALSTRDASCVVRALGKTSDAAIERRLLIGAQRVLSTPLVTCVAQSGLEEAGFTPAQARCAVRRLRSRFSDTQLMNSFVEAADGKLDGSSRRLVGVMTPCLTG